MNLKIKQQHLMLQDSIHIFYDDLQLPPIGLLKVYESINFDIYLLYFHDNYSSMNLTEQNTIKCHHAKEFGLIPTNYSNDALLYVMKRYHRPCQQTNQTNTIVCFYDPQIYFCFCNATTHRSLCFFCDFKYDRCNECLNDGSCYAGERKLNQTDFICRCAPCIYGALCEYRMNHLQYTFESLLALDLSSKDSKPKYTTWIYISISAVMVTTGFVSNTITYKVLAHQTNIQSIIPRYIQLIAITSQLTLICSLIQIIYITLTQYSNLNESFINLFFCKSSSYVLNCLAYINKWYIASLSINRSQHTSQKNVIGRYTRKQFIWPLIIIIIIFIFNGTEVISHRLVNDPRKPKHPLCTIDFPESVWRIFETIFRLIMHIIPFISNIYAVIIIIRTVARSKANINKTNFLSEIWKQIKQHYE